MTIQAGKKLAAVYHTGAFVPKAFCELPEAVVIGETLTRI